MSTFTGMKRSALPILFVYVIVVLLGFSLILPLLPYYASAFQATPFVIGLLGTSNALAQFPGPRSWAVSRTVSAGVPCSSWR